MDRRVGEQMNGQAGKWTSEQIDEQENVRADERFIRQMDEQVSRLMDEQANRLTDEQMSGCPRLLLSCTVLSKPSMIIVSGYMSACSSTFLEYIMYYLQPGVCIWLQ